MNRLLNSVCGETWRRQRFVSLFIAIGLGLAWTAGARAERVLYFSSVAGVDQQVIDEYLQQLAREGIFAQWHYREVWPGVEEILNAGPDTDGVVLVGEQGDGSQCRVTSGDSLSRQQFWISYIPSGQPEVIEQYFRAALRYRRSDSVRSIIELISNDMDLDLPFFDSPQYREGTSLLLVSQSPLLNYLNSSHSSSLFRTLFRERISYGEKFRDCPLLLKESGGFGLYLRRLWYGITRNLESGAYALIYIPRSMFHQLESEGQVPIANPFRPVQNFYGLADVVTLISRENIAIVTELLSSDTYEPRLHGNSYCEPVLYGDGSLKEVVRVPGQERTWRYKTMLEDLDQGARVLSIIVRAVWPFSLCSLVNSGAYKAWRKMEQPYYWYLHSDRN